MSNNTRKGLALFHTRQAGNEGTVMPLRDPATGALTPHWIRILSVDSDVYQDINTRGLRRVALIPDNTSEADRIAIVQDTGLDVVVAICVDWSFADPELMDGEAPVPCTPENVKAFLRESPHIRKAIDAASGERSFFLQRSSQPSSGGQSTISGSPENPLEVSQP